MSTTNNDTLIDLISTLWRQATGVNDQNQKLHADLEKVRAELAAVQLALAESKKQAE